MEIKLIIYCLKQRHSNAFILLPSSGGSSISLFVGSIRVRESIGLGGGDSDSYNGSLEAASGLSSEDLFKML